jgi:hypothetical protein
MEWFTSAKRYGSRPSPTRRVGRSRWSQVQARASRPRPSARLHGTSIKMPRLFSPLRLSSSGKDLKNLPEDIRRQFGYALLAAQEGEKSDAASSLIGFGGAQVLEVVTSQDGSTFRAVYTLKFRRGAEQPRPRCQHQGSKSRCGRTAERSGSTHSSRSIEGEGY